MSLPSQTDSNRDLAAKPLAMESPLADYLQESARVFGLPRLAVGLIDAGGSVEREEIAGDRSPGRLHKVGSLTKLVTALAILGLEEHGALRLTDQVSDHLSWFTDMRGRRGTAGTTLGDLLLHLGGLRRGRFREGEPSEEEIRGELGESPAADRAGKRVVYSNLGYVLLGFVVARRSGENYAFFVERTILGPLGMRETGFGLPRVEGEMTSGHRLKYFLPTSTSPFDHEPAPLRNGPAAAFDMYSSCDDMMTLFACLLNGGRHAGRQVIGRRTIELLAETRHPIDARLESGLGFRRMKAFGGEMWFENGEHFGHSASMLLLPQRKIALLALANRGSAGLELAGMLNTLARYLVGGRDPVELHHRPRGSGAPVGIFTADNGTAAEIIEAGGRLTMAVGGELPVPLVYKGQGCFVKCGGRFREYVVQLDPRIGRTRGLCLGPHYFAQGDVPPDTAKGSHATVVGIYRNAKVGRIALFERCGALILAYSPGKEARLMEEAPGVFVQADGPFPGEKASFEAAGGRLTLGGLTFERTPSKY